MPPEAWYEMYVKALHRELAMMGMRVLSRIISACERGCSAHWHIHGNIRNKLGPETTVYVYTNSKMAAVIHDANELKMFAWDNEDM